MNEDYISNQIAVYKNSKTLIEFQDKLKIASVCSYAHRWGTRCGWQTQAFLNWCFDEGLFQWYR